MDTIEIKLPAPLTPVAAITRAIGILWPDATMTPTDGTTLRFNLPTTKPRAGRTTDKALKDVKAEELDTPTEDARLETLHQDGTFSNLSTPSEATQALAWHALSLLEATEGAHNYLEQEFSTPQELRDQGLPEKVVFIVAYGKDRTPSALRDVAERERERDEALARVAELEAEVERMKRGGG